MNAEHSASNTFTNLEKKKKIKFRSDSLGAGAHQGHRERTQIDDVKLSLLCTELHNGYMLICMYPTHHAAWNYLTNLSALLNEMDLKLF